MLLVPVLAIAGAVMWFGGPALRDRMSGRSLAPRARAAEEVSGSLEHAGFRASFEHAGSTVSLRLAPLHAAPERLAFDAASLARRLGLEAEAKGSIPWRLELSRSAGSEGGSWSLEGLAVRSGDGQLRGASDLLPLDLGKLPEGDPLGVLLAPDPAGLKDGQSQTVLLWGPASCPDPILDGFGKFTALQAETWTARGDDEALMRLEPLR